MAINPNSPNTRPLSVTLQGAEYGKFAGATVSTVLSGAEHSLVEDTAAQSRLAKDMARLIKAGRILWTEPGEALDQKKLFDAHGQPYMGVVKWVDGKPTIERVQIVS